MSNTLTYEDQAREIGKNAGRCAASWIVDGTTERATAERMLQQLEDGDPASEDWMPRVDLSGEYAEDWTPHSLLRFIFGCDYLTSPMGDAKLDNGSRIPAEELEGIFEAFEEGAAVGLEHGCEGELRMFLA